MSEETSLCGAKTRAGTPCQRPPMDNGRCYHHGGATDDGGPPENNQNSVKHGLYADQNKFYQNLSDELTTLCDEIFSDYCTKYRELYGDHIETGHQARLFEIAVNHIKIIHSDNWLQEKPQEIESGNPVVDSEQHFTQEGRPYNQYKESVVIQTQQKLRREDRAWLKDYGLLNDPESQKADAISEMNVEIVRQEYDHS